MLATVVHTQKILIPATSTFSSMEHLSLALVNQGRKEETEIMESANKILGEEQPPETLADMYNLALVCNGLTQVSISMLGVS
ncbi:hypothetical protein F4810DRAFT_711939 [Camillea tinctor]|nr:hypothetical protein F4810DRAFT_711939 [Camillea tinctor]